MKRHKWPFINWKAINLKTLVQPLLGVLLFSSVVVLVMNQLTDLAYRLVDPRIKAR